MCKKMEVAAKTTFSFAAVVTAELDSVSFGIAFKRSACPNWLYHQSGHAFERGVI